MTTNNLSYEIAVSLKKAGFPQEGEGYVMEHPDCKGWDEPHPDCTFKKRPYSPTLSELIDAIGMIVLFYSPGDNMRDKGWYAAEGWLEVDGYYKPSEGARKTKNGATPEEAVANLYLALHNK